MPLPRPDGLRQALELYDLAEALVTQRLAREPLSPADRAQRLREWRIARPAARHGDSTGRPIEPERFR